MKSIHYSLGFAFSIFKNDVLLITKKRPPWQFGMLNGIGGKIEFGESPIDCMKREFKEETGLDGLHWDFVCQLDSVVQDTNETVATIFCFSSFSDKIYDSLSTTDEKIGIYRYSDLPTNIMPNLKWLLPLAIDPFVRSATIVEYTRSKNLEILL